MIRDRHARKPASPHWRRYRVLMGWMVALSAALAAGALVWMRVAGTPMPWQGRLAVGAGVFFTMLLTGALMGLLFTSARSGHDASIEDRARD